jgi:hypothetical protein
MRFLSNCSSWEPAELIVGVKNMILSNEKIIFILITLLLLLMPTEIFAGPQALGGLYLIGVFIFLFLSIYTLCFIGIIFLLKRRKLKSKFSKTLFYSLTIMLTLIYLPSLGWFLWEAVFENVLWSLEVKGIPTKIIFICSFILISIFVLKRIIHFIKKDEMPNTTVKRDA